MIESIADRFIILWGWRRYLSAALLGAFSVLAFAPMNLSPVLWVTFPALVWLLDGAEADRGPLRKRFLSAFAIGWWFGFGFFTAGLHWMASAFFVDPGRDALLVPFALFGLPAGLAVFWGLATGFARLIWPQGWSRILSLTIFLFLAEWLRGTILTGFPWNLLGYALAPSPLFMQTASLIGIYGLTFFAILIFATPAVLTGNRFGWGESRPFLAVVVLLIAAHAGFGFFRLSTTDIGETEAVRLRLVQPAIPQTEKWKPENRAEILQTYLDLSAQPGDDKTDVLGITHLIWPEVALPYLLADDAATLAAIADLLPPQTRLVTGAIRRELDFDANGQRTEPAYFNSVYVVDDHGSLRDAYDKIHLVPFGEYLPARSFLEGIGLTPLTRSAGRFQAGRRLHPVETGIGPSIGVLICYEAIFPDLASGWTSRTSSDQAARPGWLLNVTNDAWFGESIGPHQHFAQARIRAVETGLPLVRAANTGISAVVDPLGRVTGSLSLGSGGIIDSVVPKALEATIYQKYGIFIPYICLFVAGAILIALISRKRDHI